MLNSIKSVIRQKLTPRSKLVILNYHQLGIEFDSKIHNKHIWNSVSFFEEQMMYLKQNFKIVSVKDGIQSLEKGTTKETEVCITFDDGDASIVSLAMPLLKRLNIPATFFINTAYGVEKAGYWYNLGPYFEDQELVLASKVIRSTTESTTYHDLLKLEDECNKKYSANQSPFYCDYTFCKNCVDPLFHFGLHGHEHFRFSMLTYKQQKLNLQRNIDAMGDWANYVPYFAVPFGQPRDWNLNTFKIARALNVIPFLAYQGYNTTHKAPFLRFSVDGVDLPSLFKNLSPFQKRYNQLNKLNAL